MFFANPSFRRATVGGVAVHSGKFSPLPAEVSAAQILEMPKKETLMSEDKLTSISASMTAKQLRRLYELLDDEATPWGLRAGRGENLRVEITLYCDADNAAYFKNMLKNEIQAEI